MAWTQTGTLVTTSTGVLRGALVFDVKDYGAVGNGSTDDAAAIQATVTAATSTGGTVYLPPGVYKVLTAIVPANNIAIVGAGIGSTVIQPGAAVCAINSVLSGTYVKATPLTRFTLAHLTIDGVNQGATFNVGYKGVFCQYLAQCEFEDLTIQNCIATGLGIDFLTQGTVIHAVRAIGNGRLNQGGGSGAGSNGIGVGTGQYTVEDFTVSDCYASGNGRYGIMIESQTSATSYGPRISNCFSTANYNHGYGSAGGNGAIWSHCVAYANNLDGFSIDNGTVGATAQPSTADTYVGCEAIGNTRYGFSYQPTANNAVSVAGGGNHTYSGCKSYGNTSLGFNINSAASHPCSGFTYVGCESFSNGASGFQVQGASNDIKISGCKINANGQTSGTSKVGILIGAAVTGLQISDNRVYDDGSTQKQAYGLQIASGITVTSASLVGNDLRGNLTGSVNMLGSWASSVVDANPGYDPPATRSTGPGSAFRLRGDTGANWTTNNPVLGLGEYGYESDTGWAKIGNGTSAWTSLAYAAAPFVNSVPTARAMQWSAATGDPSTLPSTFTPATGVIYFSRCYVDQAYTSCAHVYCSTIVAGVTLTNCYIGVYDVVTGNQLGKTADISSSLTTITGLQASLAVPITGLVYGQELYLALLIGSSSTTPGLAGTRANGGNLGMTSNYRVQISAGSQTTLPGTVPTLSLPGSGAFPGLGIGP
jgi:hypothetical protein